MTRKLLHTEPHGHEPRLAAGIIAPQHNDGSVEQHGQQETRSSTWVTLLQYNPSSKLRSHIVPAAHGFVFTPAKDTHFRIIDLHGQQVVDFMSWTLPFSLSNNSEHFSASYTRYRIGGSAPPVASEGLYSNRDRKMFEIVEDKVKCHDMLFMACNPSFYGRLGKEGHRSCAGNVAEAMNSWLSRSSELVLTTDAEEDDAGVKEGKRKFEWHDVHDPFNIFQNTPYYTLKALECSRAGDWIEMKALMRCVVAVSSCPYEEDGFNGGKVTEVGVVWEEE